MRNWMLAAGAAALAIGAPALSQGQGNGKGGGQSGGPKVERGGGNGGNAKADRGGKRGDDRANNVMRGNEGRGQKSDRILVRNDQRGRDEVKIKVKGNGNDRAMVKVDRGGDGIRVVDRDFDGDRFVQGRGLAFGCPPGLDKKGNGCMPPGQVKTLLGAPLRASFANSLLPLQYRNWYRDDDDYFYRTGDGFIYRINRDNSLVDGLIPLFGDGYYMVGDPWPDPYNFYNVPYQYRTYYPDGGDYLYRFGDGAIYSIDPTSQVVRSIVALLAGDLGVGQPLPVGYNTYNVPLAYRDRYYDTADNWYRYNDGYIYRVDPTTRLITAVIDAIV
jgi:hypothetical protein